VNIYGLSLRYSMSLSLLVALDLRDTLAKEVFYGLACRTHGLRRLDEVIVLLSYQVDHRSI
jgi:hypothetical protein